MSDTFRINAYALFKDQVVSSAQVVSDNDIPGDYLGEVMSEVLQGAILEDAKPEEITVVVRFTRIDT